MGLPPVERYRSFGYFKRMNETTVTAAIEAAEALLPGEAAPDDELDPRWQAIIEVSEFIPSDPDAVWAFTAKWGVHDDEDLRTAIATCLLEHLLEHHFDLIFPRVEKLAMDNARFSQTFGSCWKFDQSEIPANSKRFDKLKRACDKKHK